MNNNNNTDTCIHNAAVNLQEMFGCPCSFEYELKSISQIVDDADPTWLEDHCNEFADNDTEYKCWEKLLRCCADEGADYKTVFKAAAKKIDDMYKTEPCIIYDEQERNTMEPSDVLYEMMDSNVCDEFCNEEGHTHFEWCWENLLNCLAQLG